MDERLLTQSEVAAILGLRHRSVRYLVRKPDGPGQLIPAGYVAGRPVYASRDVERVRAYREANPERRGRPRKQPVEPVEAA
jgi:hypothetical protein